MATTQLPIERREQPSRRGEEPFFRQVVGKRHGCMSQEEFANWLILQSVSPLTHIFWWLKVKNHSESLEPERWLSMDVAFSRNVTEVANAFDRYHEELKTYRDNWKVSCGFILSRRRLVKLFAQYTGAKK